MFLRLNQLSFKQWFIIKSIYIAKQFLPYNLYILFIKLISNISKSQIMKKVYKLCPPSKIPEAASICYKIKNFLSLSR
jgi:hypothetical protein